MYKYVIFILIKKEELNKDKILFNSSLNINININKINNILL